MNDKIPLIRTLESDMNEFSKNEDSPVLAAQKQLENRIIPDMSDGSDSKWKILIRIILIIVVLLVVGFAAYKLTVGTKPAAKPIVKNKPVVAAPKLFTVSDIWPSMRGTLASSTGEATSTNAFVIISVTNFNNVYEGVLQNEDKISELASKYFQIDNLSPFTQTDLNNVSLRVSDGGDKPLFYGYAGQKYLIFTTSISDFFKIYEKLGGNASKSS